MRNGLFALLAANKGRGKFHAQATGQGEATIWLYDAIVSDDYWGGVSALTLGKALAEHRDKATIHLRINSPGGDVFAGRAMEVLLSEHPAKIVTHIDGYAASAASYVALAGEERIISPGGMFMIHKAWTLAWGNADDIRKTAALLDQIDETLVATYVTKTGQTAEQLREWIAAETWLTAEQSLEYGFATAIAGQEAAPEQNSRATNRAPAWDLSAYALAPKIQQPANEITDDLTARQAALYDAVEKIAEDFGPFDTGTGPTGAHYVSAADNPNNPGNTFDRAAALRRLEACTIAYT